MSQTAQEINLDNVEFKPVGGETTYVKGKSLNEAGILGEILIGTYKSASENKFGKSYAFTLAKTADLGAIGIVEAGKTLIVNGCSTLDRQMSEVDEGSLVQVVYDGLKEGKENDYHAFTVNVAQ